MSNGPFLAEVDNFDSGVYQLQTTDPALGGPNGVMNVPPTSLANRTRYLLNRAQDGKITYAQDTGVANAYVALLSPVTFTTLVDGMEVRFRVANANTGAATFTPSTGANGTPNIAPLPIYGHDGNQLTGGEFVVNGEVTLRYNAALNAGNGAWVIMSSVGGIHHSATPAANDNSTSTSTTAWLWNNILALVNSIIGSVTGVTPAAGDNSTKVATTAFVQKALQSNGGMYAVDSGVANAYVGLVNPVTFAALTDGMTVNVRISHANTGASTFTPSNGTVAGSMNIAPLPIYDMDGNALMGGELVANGEVTLRYNSAVNAWVLMASAGGIHHTVTPGASDNSTKVSTTAWVWNNMLALVNNVIGNVTGLTAAANDNSTKLSTTAWVWNNILALVNSVIGTVTGVTPAQFDASTKLATTAFVQESLGSRAGQTNYAGAQVLTNADIGKITVMTGGNATLPLAANAAAGSVIKIVATNGARTVLAQGTDTITLPIGTTVASLSVPAQGYAIFERNAAGNSWNLAEGDTQLQYSPFFASALSANGYKKVPDSSSPTGYMIYQWGSYALPSQSVTSFNFPIAFPNAALHLFGTLQDNGPTVNYRLSMSSLTTTGGSFVQTYTASLTVHWFAIGY